MVCFGFDPTNHMTRFHIDSFGYFPDWVFPRSREGIKIRPRDEVEPVLSVETIRSIINQV